MTLYNLKVTTHGKWILSGEHAILRGRPAIVYPLHSKSIVLKYYEQANPLTAEFYGTYPNDMRLLFFSVVEHACRLSQCQLIDISGKVELTNDIPIGAGLGASAALCLAIAKLFSYLGKIQPNEQISFATTLEDLFHKKSSGLDLLGSASDSGILVEQGEVKKISATWSPKWYLSYSGHIGITSHCVQKVNQLWEDNPKELAHIDDMMSKSVNMAYKALTSTKVELDLLKQSIDMAYQCFIDWGLVGEGLKQHIDLLKSSGAIAAKPTGSGSGGYVLSLWKSAPKKSDLTFINA